MNVMQYSAVVEMNWKANLGDMTSWKPNHTFYNDLAIAEFCEVYMRDRGAVKKTYNALVKNYGTDYKAMTELCMVLNHKSWAFADKVDSKYLGVGDKKAEEYGQLYAELWAKTDNMFARKFGKNDEAMSYFFDVTD